MSTVIDLATRRKASPISESGKVSPPRRRKNKETRSREHLTPDEVAALIDAARGSGRYGQRDSTLILVMYRHGLRVSEAIALRWEAVELKQGLLHVTRLKNGTPSTHPLRGPELRALRALRADWEQSPYVFCSERGGPMTASNVRKMIARVGRQAKLPFPVHPHQLRHALGYKLAGEGQDTRAIQLYLGHRSITHTARYTELSPGRFKNFFTD
jgi:type 1 fimbriae regulatory protein FimB/type 1 fimbriae regulatory protein FimE